MAEPRSLPRLTFDGDPNQVLVFVGGTSSSAVNENAVAWRAATLTLRKVFRTSSVEFAAEPRSLPRLKFDGDPNQVLMSDDNTTSSTVNENAITGQATIGTPRKVFQTILVASTAKPRSLSLMLNSDPTQDVTSVDNTTSAVNQNAVVGQVTTETPRKVYQTISAASAAAGSHPTQDNNSISALMKTLNYGIRGETKDYFNYMDHPAISDFGNHLPDATLLPDYSKAIASATLHDGNFIDIPLSFTNVTTPPDYSEAIA
jgi:hypothetical protein